MGRKPFVIHLHVLYCQAKVKIYNPHKKKFDSRTINEYFISYPEKFKEYRFYCLNYSTIIVEYENIKFIENDEISRSIETTKSRNPISYGASSFACDFC